MADNIVLNQNTTTGATLAADDVSGVYYPIGKTAFGADGVAATLVDATHGLPVHQQTGTTWAVSLASVPSHAVTNAGTFAVQVDALPAGLATGAKQDTGNTSLASIDGKVPALGQALAAASVPVVLTGAQIATLTPLATVAVTGVSTAAKQDTIIASLSAIDGHVDGLEASVASIDAKITAVNTGAVVVASSALPTGAATAARQDTANTSLGSLDAKAPALGQALAAASVPVVLTAAQVTTLTPPAAITGFATESTLSTLNGKVTACNTGAVVLAAGTAAIGKLTANTGVTIGAVELAAAQTLATVTTLTTCSTLTTLTGGGVAHDGADSGNPVKVGARAASTLSDDTMVANGDRTDAVADLDGALLVRGHAPLGDLISEQVSNTNGTSTAFTNFGATASTRNYVTAIVVYNSSATPGYLDIRDGTGGSVLYTVPLPAGGGAVVTLGGAPLFRSTANTALAYDVSAALSTVYISMTGFKSKV